MAKTILAVDDEKDILELIKYNLQKEGYSVLTARTGKQALEQAQLKPNLILLDVMMPESDGWDVIKQLKRNPKTASIPVVFLTAKGTEVDEVLGLELGAEDFILKPISIPKLLARIKNVLRKYDTKEVQEQTVIVGPIEINPRTHTVSINKKEIFFPKKEFDLLFFLAQHPGDVINRESLLNSVWGSDVRVVDRTIDVHIRKIREKLGEDMDMIETIKGVGYRLRES